MPSFDYSDADQYDRLQREPLNVEINALAERAAATTARAPRPYLGASIAGHECARQVQYDWWCTPELPARVRLIFDRGHAFEALAKKQLSDAGFVFAPKEALEFEAPNLALQGHADGIIIGGPSLPGAYHAFPCVWECKALNSKNFRAVARNGFALTFPRYAVQVALYQFYLDKLNPALVTAINANTCEVLHRVLPFDARRAEQALERIRAIIEATRAGDLLPRAYDAPDDWRCMICAHRRRCWGLSS
jgi:hypothetical protein